MKTKKLLSVVLIALMLLSCVPIFASAAEPEALKATNVTQWPTITYKNGGDSINFGETVGDTIIINDDEIVLDAAGNQVAGHFEHRNPNQIPSASDAVRASLTFVPDDTTAYTGFNKLSSRDVTFKVNKVTPIPVDPDNAFPVATEVEAGATLDTSVLTNPAYTNPYNAEEPKLLAAEWRWYGNYNTIINESGYYQAFLSVAATGYTDMVTWVLVRVKGDTSEPKMGTTIEELPTVEGEYEVGDKWTDVKLVGGKAVGMDGTELSGTFHFDTTATVFKKAATYGTNVIFTPDDSNYASARSAQSIDFTVNKAPVKFVDENGNEIIPEIELGYNNKQLKYNLDEIEDLLAPYANCDQFWANFYADGMDMPHAKDALEAGTTKEYEIRASSYNDNYTGSILKFKLTVVPRACTMTLRYTENTIKVQTNKPTTDDIYGTFEYYANGELIGTSAITTVTDSTALRWKPEKSGTYDIAVKYVVAENDKYYFPEATIEDMEILYSWGVTVNGGSVKVSNSYKDYGTFTYGDSVSILGAGSVFSHWVITDKDGNEIDIEGVDKTVSGNTFIMPDFDVIFTAVELTQRKVNLENAIILNAVGTADAPVRYRGENVRIKLDTDALSEDMFNRWVITDADGKEFLPEGITEADLTSTQISFIMPDHDITVRAATAADDCDHLCHSDNPLYQMFWKIISFFFRLLNIQQYCDCGMLHYDAPLFG